MSDSNYNSHTDGSTHSMHDDVVEHLSAEKDEAINSWLRAMAENKTLADRLEKANELIIKLHERNQALCDHVDVLTRKLSSCSANGDKQLECCTLSSTSTFVLRSDPHMTTHPIGPNSNSSSSSDSHRKRVEDGQTNDSPAALGDDEEDDFEPFFSSSTTKTIGNAGTTTISSMGTIKRNSSPPPVNANEIVASTNEDSTLDRLWNCHNVDYNEYNSVHDANTPLPINEEGDDVLLPHKFSEPNSDAGDDSSLDDRAFDKHCNSLLRTPSLSVSPKSRNPQQQQQRSRGRRPTAQHTHNSARRYQCTTCSQWFRDKYNLNHHVMVHTGEKPYKCELCERAFSRINLRRQHMEHEHGVPMVKYSRQHVLDAALLEAALKRQAEHDHGQPILHKHKQAIKHDIQRIYGT